MIGDWFEQGVFPVDISREIGALGLLGSEIHTLVLGEAITGTAAYR